MCRRNSSISSSPVNVFRAIALALAVLSVIACGYRMIPAGENLPEGVRTIYVEAFSNRTAEAKIENTFRSAFIEEFVRGGRLKLADGPAEAHAVLSGEITRFLQSPLSYGSDDLAAEERISVTLALTLRAQDSGSVLWMDKNFSDYDEYILLSRDVRAIQTAREKAVAVLARRMAEKAYGLMMSGF